MKKSLTLASLILITSCASGPCLNPKKDQALTDTSEKTSVLGQKIRVYKYDGSKQCGIGKSMPLEDMQKELGSIKVYSSANKNDGQMRVQLCGSPTGNANVYEIEKSDLEKAQKSGFKEWIFE